MTSLKWIATGAAMLTGCGLVAAPAQAGYVVTLEQMGSNVVATGSGAVDLTGLTTRIRPGFRDGAVNPSKAGILDRAGDSHRSGHILFRPHIPGEFRERGLDQRQ